MGERSGRDEIVNAREESNDARTPGLPLCMKKIEDSSHKNPGSEEPKESNDNAAKSKRRRALIARTDGLVRHVMSVHRSDPTDSIVAAHRMSDGCREQLCRVA